MSIYFSVNSTAGCSDGVASLTQRLAALLLRIRHEIGRGGVDEGGYVSGLGLIVGPLGGNSGERIPQSRGVFVFFLKLCLRTRLN
jgi:hypothetical protein